MIGSLHCIFTVENIQVVTVRYSVQFNATFFQTFLLWLLGDTWLGSHFWNLDCLCCHTGNRSMLTQNSLIEINFCWFSVLAVSDGPSSIDHQNETAPFKLEATVPSRLALGTRCGYSQRCWGSPVRQKKKHTGTHFGHNVYNFFID